MPIEIEPDTGDVVEMDGTLYLVLSVLKNKEPDPDGWSRAHVFDLTHRFPTYTYLVDARIRTARLVLDD